MNAPFDEHRVRTHESGHAIAGSALDRTPTVIVAAGRNLARTTHAVPTKGDTDRMSLAELRAFFEADAIIDLAGEAALALAGDPDPRDGAETDRRNALRSARSLDPKTPEATLDRLYQRALALVRQHQAAIVRLAETLAVNHGRLAGREVEIALDAAFGGWLTPKFDQESQFDIMVRRRDMFNAACRDTDTDDRRLELWRDAESAAWAGLSLAQYRRDGLYAPRPAK